MKKTTKITLIISSSLIIILGLLAYLLLINVIIKPKYTDEYVDMKLFPDLGGSNRIYYSEIRSVELHDTIYDNKFCDGRQYATAEIGWYYNDIYGEYHSFVHRNADLSVYIITENELHLEYKFVVGLRSEKKTKELYEFLLEKMNK